MKPKNEIIKSPDYWLTKIQNELYREMSDYMKRNNLNQNDIAKKLNVSRGYINQVLNGNFNFTLKKLIELSLAMDKIPSLKFEKIKSEAAVIKVNSENENHKRFLKSKKKEVA